ncbi:MAG: amidohydrolase family protein, partial [Sporomusa sp.]
VLPLAHRVHELGWHVQVVAKAEQILAGKDVWDKIPCTIVFDHLAHIPHVNHPAFALVIAMLRQQECWVKLSGAYILSASDAPSYADRYAVAKGYVDAAPEQVVWVSDWPHPTVAGGQKPDDAILLDLLADWAPEVTVRGKILVDNPARLYGF